MKSSWNVYRNDIVWIVYKNCKLSKVSVHNSTQPVLQKIFIDKLNIYLKTHDKVINPQPM